jgi:hypothetical protein
MHKKIVQILTIIIFIICIDENGMTNDSKIYKITEIPNQAVERLNNSFLYVIKFSNLIYNVNEKKIIIPIFQGNLPSVEYTDFKKYCREKKILDPKTMESGFVIRTKKGEVKKTIIEFVKFYQGNLLKGIKQPFEIYTDGDEPQYLVWNVVYKFSLEGIPCTMKISFEADKKDWGFRSKIKTIDEMHPNEKMGDPVFTYEIIVNDQE